MKKIAVVSVILEDPQVNQKEFNELISSYMDIIIGRMGLPVQEKDIALISLAISAEMDLINELTGKIGQLSDTKVKVIVSEA